MMRFFLRFGLLVVLALLSSGCWMTEDEARAYRLELEAKSTATAWGRTATVEARDMAATATAEANDVLIVQGELAKTRQAAANQAQEATATAWEFQAQQTQQAFDRAAQATETQAALMVLRATEARRATDEALAVAQAEGTLEAARAIEQARRTDEALKLRQTQDALTLRKTQDALIVAAQVQQATAEATRQAMTLERERQTNTVRAWLPVIIGLPFLALVAWLAWLEFEAKRRREGVVRDAVGEPVWTLDDRPILVPGLADRPALSGLTPATDGQLEIARLTRASAQVREALRFGPLPSEQAARALPAGPATSEKAAALPYVLVAAPPKQAADPETLKIIDADWRDSSNEHE